MKVYERQDAKFVYDIWSKGKSWKSKGFVLSPTLVCAKLHQSKFIVGHMKKWCFFSVTNKSHNSATTKVDIGKIERDQTSINSKTCKFHEIWSWQTWVIVGCVDRQWFTIIHSRPIGTKLGRNVHRMVSKKFMFFIDWKLTEKIRGPNVSKKVFSVLNLFIWNH